MNEIKNLSLLLQIAERTIALHHCQIVTKHRKEILSDAYRKWKHDNDVDEYVERGDETWDEMMNGTKPEFAQVTKAKQQERNAKNRVGTVVRRYLDQQEI